MIHHVKDLIEGILWTGVAIGVIIDEFIHLIVRRVRRHRKGSK